MKKFKSTLEFLGLNYKKELIKIVGINFGLIGLIIASYFLLDQIYIFIVLIIGCVLINYILLTSYSSKMSRVMKDREDEFVSIISYFQIFIENHTNVYHAFECLIPYTSDWMANEISNLLKDIDRDKTVKPYIDFARLFDLPVIENVMLSIYQMVDEGENVERLSQFSLIFDDFSKAHHKTLLESKQKSLDSLNNYPMIGAGLITVVLTFSVMSIIGEMVNVI